MPEIHCVIPQPALWRSRSTRAYYTRRTAETNSNRLGHSHCSLLAVHEGLRLRLRWNLKTAIRWLSTSGKDGVCKPHRAGTTCPARVYAGADAGRGTDTGTEERELDTGGLEGEDHGAQGVPRPTELSAPDARRLRQRADLSAALSIASRLRHTPVSRAGTSQISGFREHVRDVDL